MEYEREPDLNFGADADESVAQPDEPTVIDTSTEAALPESIGASPARPDPTAGWPTADFVAGASAANDDESEDDGEPADDDSDAPIQLNDQAHDAPVHGDVRGDVVNISQGGAQRIDANEVHLYQGGAVRVRADEMTVDQGGVVVARADRLTLQTGSMAFAVVANEATVNDGASTFLIVARSVRGDVQPTIDWRSALAFGAGLGIVLSIIRRLR